MQMPTPISDAVPHAGSLPYLLRALQENLENPAYWLGYLEALMRSDQLAEARGTLALGRTHGLAGPAVEDFGNRLDAREGESALLSALKQQRLPDARALGRGMTERFPDRGLAWKIVGALHWEDGLTDEALAAMRVSVRLAPRDAEAHTNLGVTCAKLNQFDEAEGSLRRAIAIDPTFATAHYRLGMTFFLQARLAEAEACLRAGVALRTGYAPGDDESNYSNLLFIASHNGVHGPDSLFAEHRRFGECFEDPLRAGWPVHPNPRDPHRRLKVGIVSGDLREHAVAGFIEPFLGGLRGRPRMELHAYHNNVTEDHVSRRLRDDFKTWNPVATLSDATLAEKIMADGIDILIDLSGHTAHNRLPVFARKPAPLQISWIGYPGTTGLQAMDYFLADPHFLPPGQFDRYFTEKLVHLPAQTPFQPHPSAPAVNPLPALATGHMTFGSFNRPDKIGDSTIRAWSRLLAQLPDARMILGGIPFPAQHRRLAEAFAAYGIAADRLTFHPPYDMDRYLALYHRVDMCLDTTPYNGGTTTIHALWMGVPTLSIAGPTPAARSGAAILGQMDLHEFVASSAGDFLEKGVYWAQHTDELARFRAGLRERWQQSPGRRADVIAAAFESALRRMWQRWCQRLPAESFQSTDGGDSA